MPRFATTTGLSGSRGCGRCQRLAGGGEPSRGRLTGREPETARRRRQVAGDRRAEVAFGVARTASRPMQHVAEPQVRLRVARILVQDLLERALAARHPAARRTSPAPAAPRARACPSGRAACRPRPRRTADDVAERLQPRGGLGIRRGRVSSASRGEMRSTRSFSAAARGASDATRFVTRRDPVAGRTAPASARRCT